MTIELAAAACLICGVRSSETSFDGLLQQCTDCHFGWTATAPAAQEMLYGHGYFEGDGYADYYQDAARRFESRLRLRWLVSSGAVGSLLEAGSAGGFFVAEARAVGIDARGVEISGAATAYATDRLGVPVRHGSFESTTPGAPVDAVCAFHVLEHVPDPAEFLRVARRNLKPLGRLALEVPNIAGAAAGRLGAAWPSIEPRYHRWHFTPDALRRLVTDAGYRVIRQDTVFSRFYWQPAARRRRLRDLFVADLVASGSPRLSHPALGDCIRLVAVPTTPDGGRESDPSTTRGTATRGVERT